MSWILLIIAALVDIAMAMALNCTDGWSRFMKPFKCAAPPCSRRLRT